ncbi:DUF1801 domain-containing protein [uncultured Draconibacterium sp.]|uniref:iron chaperone n=1 Tax=uncultured Draconibacterium sp. TaxID=1573823 RepID=UPI0029C7DF45|nr:DUF1801 domain-containing protein [uncultured Draconibacterium sp.]
MNKPATVDKYISAFSTDTQSKLVQIREIIQTNAPDAIESISYGMPAYKLNKKPLVYFGGFEKHIGFYATPSGHEKFKNQLSTFKQGKGSVQFPINKALPLDLIAEIVKFRVEEIKRLK